MKSNAGQNSASGLSLISLMVGLVVSAFLLLIISQLAFIARQNYVHTQNLIELYDNAREAMTFLRQNIQMSGFGILQPVSADNMQLNSTSYTGPPPTGGSGQLFDWVYIGYYQENPSPNRLFPNAVIATGATPSSCAQNMNANFSSLQFFGLQSCGQCWSPNPAGAAFDKSVLTVSAGDTSATCCEPAGASCAPPAAGTCGLYNCGGSLQNAIYQKMMPTVCVGVNCVGADPTIVPNGDVLTVYFSNPGPGLVTNFSGTDIAVSPTQPPAQLNSYTFYVDNGSSTLRTQDAALNNVFNITNNIEYMAVLVGESDLYSSVNLAGSLYSVPTVSRYVSYNTANLYPYRISAIRIAFVVRSQDQILATVPANPVLPLMLGNDGNWVNYTAPSDRYLRKVFSMTIYLKSYGLPNYRTHCVNVGGVWYIKTGGIPFASTWTANDQCCGGAPCKTYDFNTCETQRMSGGCW